MPLSHLLFVTEKEKIKGKYFFFIWKHQKRIQTHNNPFLITEVHKILFARQSHVFALWIQTDIQLNCNGSNIFGTMEICSRYGLFWPLRVNHAARSGGKWQEFRKTFSIFYTTMVCWVYSLDSPSGFKLLRFDCTFVYNNQWDPDHTAPLPAPKAACWSQSKQQFNHQISNTL